jgi:hypothetical protein
MRVKTEQRISNIRVLHFYPRWYVRTTRRGSRFCFVLVLVLADKLLNQNTALLSNFTMLSAYYTICIARQLGPAALPGSLARQPCPVALPGSLVRHAALHAFTGRRPSI